MTGMLSSTGRDVAPGASNEPSPRVASREANGSAQEGGARSPRSRSVAEVAALLATI